MKLHPYSLFICGDYAYVGPEFKPVLLKEPGAYAEISKQHFENVNSDSIKKLKGVFKEDGTQ